MKVVNAYRREVARALREPGGPLYLLASLFGSVAVVVAIYHVVRQLEQHESPGILSVIVAFCLTLTFACKTPYLYHKILARTVLLVWAVMWLLIAIATLVAYLRAKK